MGNHKPSNELSLIFGPSVFYEILCNFNLGRTNFLMFEINFNTLISKIQLKFYLFPKQKYIYKYRKISKTKIFEMFETSNHFVIVY